MKLLNITKEIDNLSLFDQLFLLDRIWKNLSDELDGLILTCASDERIMEEINQHCAQDNTQEGMFDETWVKENLPDNVVLIHSKDVKR